MLGLRGCWGCGDAGVAGCSRVVGAVGMMGTRGTGNQGMEGKGTAHFKASSGLMVAGDWGIEFSETGHLIT